MIISLSQQVDLVVYSFLAGIITGVFFDMYRLFRGFSTPNKFLTFIEDMLFWILTAIVIFIFLLYTNYAYIGFYVYMWLIVGIYIYLKLVSRHFIKIQHRIMLSIGKLMRIFIKMISFPFKFLFYRIKQKIKENQKMT